MPVAQCWRLERPMSDAPFYDNGLRFNCTRCSHCCRHEPGHVFLSANDLQRLADGLELSVQQVAERYCEIVDVELAQRISLRERSNHDCVFWVKGGCAVYEHRPLQCRAFPFWSVNLLDREAWQKLEASCPGVNQGALHERSEIDSWIDERERDPFLDVGEF